MFEFNISGSFRSRYSQQRNTRKMGLFRATRNHKHECGHVTPDGGQVTPVSPTTLHPPPLYTHHHKNRVRYRVQPCRAPSCPAALRRRASERRVALSSRRAALPLSAQPLRSLPRRSVPCLVVPRRGRAAAAAVQQCSVMSLR